ncbi:MAG: DUF488 domain-containing protein [Parvularculaceae bacterium]|jgi:uncharacterized protein YeaO (DUF488 family)|nr:DUF488 domain-containing protein [Parvularculaceae bacterium]
MAQSYDLHVKRIYEPPSPDDGARVLVDRVWPRGVRKEAAQLTLWLKDIAPSSALRKWFGHDPLLWGEFRRRYRVELDANRPAVERLDRCIKSGRTTLLFAARDTEHNQALVLADYMKARRH